ncbi:zinc finger FYVE domain-containing protein 26-like protein [Leptotrombidium deliense]|uniref:Zinc finger FYVE domain-containing protein 26-like protein n=1 Tax=Leptotrombidium deliense TaxID=299467 RepID=A0A443RXW1_9ACAR|nr:zinc finger FYVE domain-containing protein 26-like protein [Leptotrombidium deliense]
MSANDVLNQIRTIDMQIEISAKFHERHVNGYEELRLELQDIDSKYSRSPPTLLDHSKARKTLLAALVAVESGATIIEGYTLSQQIIKYHALDAAQVFRFAGKIIMRTQNLAALSDLLGCIRASLSHEDSAALCDDVVGACIRSYVHDTTHMEPLIKLLTSDINKIDAYILCNKLKSAYLLAVRLERVGDVKRIHSLAVRSNQEKIRQICEAFLVKFKHN